MKEKKCPHCGTNMKKKDIYVGKKVIGYIYVCMDCGGLHQPE